MKLTLIFAAFALSSFVESHLWAAAIRGIEPIILSFGAAFAALGLDNKPNYDGANFIRLINMKKLIEEKREEYDIWKNDGDDIEIVSKPTLIEEYNEKAKTFAEALVD